ncbi:argonaut-like protein [Anaeramoeba flamelloides]|uniref:Argonaut-like protein n=1 Tax=Anaeramoeba flamelloides TaxID=1746091 RepID=A0AAV7ZQP3_9EUKA|nr:argonaut-like protein [Anaeramoeba flamelloides]
MTFQFKKLNKKKKQTILLDTNSIRKRNNRKIDRRKSITLRNIEGFMFKRKRLSNEIETPISQDFLENDDDFLKPKNKKTSKKENFKNVKFNKKNQNSFRTEALQNNPISYKKQTEQKQKQNQNQNQKQKQNQNQNQKQKQKQKQNQKQKQKQNFRNDNLNPYTNDSGFEIYQENFEEEQNFESDSCFEVVIDSESEPLMMNSSNDSSIDSFSILPKSKFLNYDKNNRNVNPTNNNNFHNNKKKKNNKNKNKIKNSSTSQSKYNDNHVFTNNNNTQQFKKNRSENSFDSLENEEQVFQLIKKIQQKERKNLNKTLPKDNQFSNLVFDIFNSAIEEAKDTLESDFIDQNLNKLQEIQSQSLNSIGVFLDSLNITGKQIENDQYEINKNFLGVQQSFKDNLFGDFPAVKNPQKLISSLIH